MHNIAVKSILRKQYYLLSETKMNCVWCIFIGWKISVEKLCWIHNQKSKTCLFARTHLSFWWKLCFGDFWVTQRTNLTFRMFYVIFLRCWLWKNNNTSFCVVKGKDPCVKYKSINADLLLSYLPTLSITLHVSVLL